MSLPPTLRHVSKSRPCAICNKPDWCLYSVDESEAICCRIQSGHFHAALNGWVHIVGDPFDGSPRAFSSPWYSETPPPEMAVLAEKYRDELSEYDLHELSISLQISTNCLSVFGIGYSRRHKAFTFPMFNGLQQVCGIRLRDMAGRKWAVSGSKNGLFMPLHFDEPGNPVVVCEGPTDAAAMTDIGFDAVGRSCCRGEPELIRRLAMRFSRDFIIVSDTDKPGIDGAHALARVIAGDARSVRVIQPVEGKDAREWVTYGANRACVMYVADSVDPYTPKARRTA